MGYILVMALAILEIIFFLTAWRVRQFIRDDNWLLLEIWSVVNVSLTMSGGFLVVFVCKHYSYLNPQISLVVSVIPTFVVGTVMFVRNGKETPKYVDKKKIQ
jgi:hypothetical protein